jgi:hypothetical protein
VELRSNIWMVYSPLAAVLAAMCYTR